MTEELRRGRREIEAARLLAANGFPGQAISRADFGAFFAAEGALATVGETRSKHAGVIATFGRRIIERQAPPVRFDVPLIHERILK